MSASQWRSPLCTAFAPAKGSQAHRGAVLLAGRPASPEEEALSTSLKRLAHARWRSAAPHAAAAAA
eukprot:11191523-Lingulodinium_polyedra.AAC.1